MTFRAATLVLLFIPRQRAEEFVEVRGDWFGEGEEPDARFFLLAVLAVEFLEDLLRRFRQAEQFVQLRMFRDKVAFTAPREASRVRVELV